MQLHRSLSFHPVKWYSTRERHQYATYMAPGSCGSAAGIVRHAAAIGRCDTGVSGRNAVSRSERSRSRSHLRYGSMNAASINRWQSGLCPNIPTSTWCSYRLTISTINEPASSLDQLRQVVSAADTALVPFSYDTEAFAVTPDAFGTPLLLRPEAADGRRRDLSARRFLSRNHRALCREGRHLGAAAPPVGVADGLQPRPVPERQSAGAAPRMDVGRGAGDRRAPDRAQRLQPI
jgi:hypothetical protein